MFKVTSTQSTRDLTIPPKTQDILLFDEKGKINVAKFNDIKQYISHYAQGNEPTTEILDVPKIAAANIIYRLASCPNVKIFEVPRETAIAHIIDNISDDIDNKTEVANQLYSNWIQVHSSQLLIQNVASERFSDELDGKESPVIKLELPVIPNYSVFIQKLLNSYINTIIDSNNHNNFKTKELLYVTELLLSTFQGRNFDIQNAILHDAIRSHFIQAMEYFTEEHKSIDRIKIFQSMLEKETGLWCIIDLRYLDNDLESLTGYDKNDIEEAFKNLLSGKLENFTTNAKLEDDLEEVRHTLTQDEQYNNFYRELITNRTTRYAAQPSLSYVIEAAKFYIYEKLKSQGFDIEMPVIAEDFKREHLLQPTIWDQPAPSEEEINTKSSQMLQIDYLRDMENGEARENSLVKTAGIYHRQDGKACWDSNHYTGQIKLSLELSEDEAEEMYNFYTQKVPNLIIGYCENENAGTPGSNYCFTLDSRIFCMHALPIMTKEGIKNEVFNNDRVEARYNERMGLARPPVSHVARLERGQANGSQDYDTVDLSQPGSHVARFGRNRTDSQSNDTVDADNQNRYQNIVNSDRGRQYRSGNNLF